jgi:transcription elongation GreA/GreB family factor
MSSLEADQLNDEGSVRAANRLRDLVADDNGLIPDFITGANINTIRNFASRLVTSASFDELTRKSLMARIIKLHPEIQDLMNGSEKVQEETLIVSESSLNEKKAAYDKLIKEEIPQNREDIKIARSYGDLRENFEYKSSKEYQRVLMKRQGDWERDLKLAQPTDFKDPDTSKVSIGTIVTLDAVGGGDALTYTVLGAWDSDPDNGIIAYLSERGNAILDKPVGTEVEFPLGDGEMKSYRITSIKPYLS